MLKNISFVFGGIAICSYIIIARNIY